MVERTLEDMLQHQAEDGQYPTTGGTKGSKNPTWTSLPCDHFAILEVLLLFGHLDSPGIRQALARMSDALAATA